MSPSLSDPPRDGSQRGFRHKSRRIHPATVLDTIAWCASTSHNHRRKTGRFRKLRCWPVAATRFARHQTACTALNRAASILLPIRQARGERLWTAVPASRPESLDDLVEDAVEPVD